LKRVSSAVAVLLLLSAFLVSCNSYSNTTGSSTGTSTKPSGLAVRAFVSNPLQPTGTAGSFSNVLNIMDATLDELTPSFVSLGSTTDSGMMALSPNKQLMMVFSPTENSIAVVNVLTESVAGSSSGLTTSTISLPGPTESMFIASDNATGYAAVPTAPVSGSNSTPGAVEVLSLSSIATTATIPVPAARYVVGSHNGNRILAFGDASNTVTVIAPSFIGTANDPRIQVVCCFDHPVWGAFSSDDTKAYILDCGPECGGTTAGITVLNMNSNTAAPMIPLPGAGATVGLLTASGSTLYVAGSPPGLSCGSGTLAVTCGTLDIVNLSSMTVTNASPIVITDGYHHRMEISNNGQLFIGATTCTNINTSSEVRGCLAIFNSNTSKVVFPPDTGDVTGLQAIANRDVVYLCEGGSFRIYDTTTNKLQIPPVGLNAVVIVGHPTDVKEVD
jgi:hypothetical protein